MLRENEGILKKYGVKRIGLFGSYTKDEQKQNSDIDLVVEFDLDAFGKDLKGLYDAFVDLSSYLESLFDRQVDILTQESVETIRVRDVAEEIKRSTIYV